jgi:hypothetical protein
VLMLPGVKIGRTDPAKDQRKINGGESGISRFYRVKEANIDPKGALLWNF